MVDHPRYERTSNSEPRRLRSWYALDDLHWASAAHPGRAARVCRGDLKTAPGRVAAGPVQHTPPRRRTTLFGQLEKDGAVRVTLAPLGEDSVAAMLTEAFGAPPDPGLADLARGAAGNPSLLGRADRRSAATITLVQVTAGTRRAGIGPAAAADPLPRAAAARWALSQAGPGTCW